MDPVLASNCCQSPFETPTSASRLVAELDWDLEKEPRVPPLSHASTFATLTGDIGDRERLPPVQTPISPVSLHNPQLDGGWDSKKAPGLCRKDEQTSSSSSVTEKPPDGPPSSPAQSGWKQTWPTLLCVVLSALLTVLVALYCSETAISTGIKFANSSSSNAIFVLSVLSGLNGVLLGATISGTIDRLLWVLVTRPAGISFLNYVTLDAGTGVAGLGLLAFGFKLPVLSKARLSSLTRLISITMVPILGVLIMSNVNTRMQFLPLSTTPPVLGWGMKPFNASLAANVSVISSQIINGLFLTDTTRAQDITPPALQSVSCNNRPGIPSTTRCQRSFLVPGGVDYVAAQFANVSTQSDYFLAVNQQGFILDFEEGDPSWTFNEADCATFGFPFAGFRLCMRNTTASSVQARVFECPSSVSSGFGCFSNTTWHSDPGWQTIMNVSFVNASVAYSRLDGSIESHDLQHPTWPAETPGGDMLMALQQALGNFTGGLDDLLAVVTDPSQLKLIPFYAYPLYIWGFLHGATTLESEDPDVYTRGAQTLQSMLSMIMYFGQPTVYAQAMRTANVTSPAAGSDAGVGDGGGNSTKTNSTADVSAASLAQFAAEMEALAPPDVKTYLAALRYQISIGRGTLAAYLSICAGIICLCLGIVGYSILAPGGAAVPQTTAFPAWNMRANCDVQREERMWTVFVDGHDQIRARMVAGGEMIDAARAMKVKVFKGLLGPVRAV